MYCAVCQSHKSAIVVRSPSRTSTLTLRRDRLCMVELLYIVAAKMYELNFMFVCIWCYLCNSNNNVFKAHCLFTSFQPYTLSLVANMHLLSSEQYKGDLSTGQVFFLTLSLHLAPSPSVHPPLYCPDLVNWRELKAFCATTDVYLIWEHWRLAGV